MEARNKTIEEWFSWIHDGLVVLPRFQRFEAWDSGQIEGILENIVRRPALPVGSLLILEIGEHAPFVARPIVGAPKPSTRPNYHLLDGQQRLTALWRSLNDNYPEMTYYVDTANESGPDVVAQKRWLKNGARFPQWCEDPVAVWSRGYVPVSLLAPGDAGAQRLQAWAKTAARDDFDAGMRILQVCAELRNRVAGFKLPFLSLPLGTDRDVALDVFIKMNTQNTPLSPFDIVVAQVEAGLEESLHEKVEGLKALMPAIVEFGDPGLIAMQVGAVLTGRPPTQASYRHPAFARDLLGAWPRIERGLKRGIAFLAEEKIYGVSFIPAEPLLTLMAALWADAPNGKDAEGVARSVARRAFWTGAFSDRYQKTSATRTELDYRQVIAYLAGGPLPDLFDRFVTPLPTSEELRSASWPSKKERLARAILAASLRVGGRDFADDTPFGPETISRREYHHVFPNGFLRSLPGAPNGWLALNCAFITWRTNRTISDKPPSVLLQNAHRRSGFPLRKSSAVWRHT